MTLKNVAVNICTDFRSGTEAKMSGASKVAVLWSKTKMILSLSRDSLTTLFIAESLQKTTPTKAQCRVYQIK
jgi:hypothetical protein